MSEIYTPDPTQLPTLLAALPGDFEIQRIEEDNGTLNYEIWLKNPYGWLFTIYGEDQPNAKNVADLMVILRNEAQKLLDRSEDLLLYGRAIKHGWSVFMGGNKEHSQGWSWYHKTEDGAFFAPGSHSGIPTMPDQLRKILKDQP